MDIGQVSKRLLLEVKEGRKDWKIALAGLSMVAGFGASDALASETRTAENIITPKPVTRVVEGMPSKGLIVAETDSLEVSGEEHTSASLKSASTQVELKEDQRITRVAADIEVAKLVLGMKSYMRDSDLQEGTEHALYFSVSHDRYNTFLRDAVATGEWQLGAEFASEQEGRFSDILLNPVLAHFDANNELFGWTVLLKGRFDINDDSQFVAAGTAGFRKQQENFEAGYLGYKGKSFGVTAGKTDAGVYRAYIGITNRVVSLGSLSELHWDPDNSSIRGVVSVAQNPGKLASPEGAVGSQDVHTIGEFIESKTHLRDLASRSKSGVVGAVHFSDGATGSSGAIEAGVATGERVGLTALAPLLGDYYKATLKLFVEVQPGVLIEGNFQHGGDAGLYVSFVR